MPTIFIPSSNLAVTLPLRRAVGDVLDEAEAELLHNIWLKRITEKLRWLLDRGALDPTTAQAKAEELALAPMQPYAASDFDEDEEDPVLSEAVDMAKTLISQRMAAEGLPVPKNIEVHAKALVSNMPALLETARKRVEARFRAAAQAIGEL